ncbi:MAG TPA: glucose-6-phosphate isomerase [Nitriliruptoraceae bacterium]|nr:glucose-6-phosphate isomerase [Nitriliruptoraceae bacterium]
MATPTDILSTDAWHALVEHHADLADTSLRDLFDTDPGRAERLTWQVADLHVDMSKHGITDETVAALVAVAQAAGVPDRIAAMYAGAHINTTEDRAVLHTALRLPRDAELVVDGQDVVADVHAVLDRMGDLSDQVRSGAWRGFTGERISAVVNIGIGGSDLGPAMAVEALGAHVQRDLQFRFVSNVDPADLAEALVGLDPAGTLFIVASKTFTTLETLTNARHARQWLLDGLGASDEAVASHFVALSTNRDGVVEFGIDEANMFEFWDWVGGRYSMTSAIGLSIMIALGRQGYADMLAGFHAVDEHFRTTPLADNVPVLLGMLACWYVNLEGAQSHVVLPYANYMRRFPAYLQQLTMESNGKSVRWDGTAVSTLTGEVYWGEPGTNGQHAFHQLLHQGTVTVPADFIGFATAVTADTLTAAAVSEMHDILMANMLAQSSALAFGRSPEELRDMGVEDDLVGPKTMPGNRPSTTILAPSLTPSTLGQLIALYEHQTFTQGVVWGIDSFDQWGVQLGKELANGLTPFVAEGTPPEPPADASTTALVETYRRLGDRDSGHDGEPPA